MTAPFTASNGIVIRAYGKQTQMFSHAGVIIEGVVYSHDGLQALVEYAATIGITAQATEEASA